MCSSVKGYSCSRQTAAERRTPMAKCYEELRFTDDFMFGKVMEDKELCREGCAKYVFESRCEENLELALGDGTVKIFYNCTCEGENLPETVRALYEYIMTGTESTGLTKRIETAVDRARCNEKWRSEYMKELLHDDDVRADAREEGRAEGREEGREEAEKYYSTVN